MKIASPNMVVIEDVLPQEPRDDQVRLSMRYCGICGSDIHAFYGEHPFIRLPAIPGHECSGIIERLGRNVSNLKIGQPVTFIPQLTCGKCQNCRKGRYNICDELRVIGAQADGAMCELFNVESELIFPLPESIDMKEAALIEPIAVSVHAMKLAGNVLGENVMILGAGPIGLFLAQVAIVAGASMVVITDIYESRLKLARKLGVDHAINARETILSKHELKRLTGESEFEVIFEAVGIEQTITQGIELVQKGGKIVVVGVFRRGAMVKMSLVQDREITIQGSLMYLKEDFAEAITLLERGKVKAQPLITSIFSIDHAADAFRTAASSKDKEVKVLISI